jgi:hypothetical protein
MQALAASCEELRARTEKPPLRWCWRKSYKSRRKVWHFHLLIYGCEGFDTIDTSSSELT